MSAIRRLLDRLYPGSNGANNLYRIPFLGLDASGKTSLLYRIKTGEIVSVIPTIGVNLETIRVKAGKEQLTMTAWGAGGCEHGGMARMIVSTFLPNADALIWVVDSNDRDRLPESVELLSEFLGLTLEYSGRKDRATLPVLVIATKYDMPNRIAIDELRAQFEPVSKGSPVRFTTSSLKDGVSEDALTWLLEHIQAVRAGSLIAPPPLPGLRSASALEAKLDEWLSYAENDSSPTEFLRQFDSLSLPKWDHYTHVRLAYVILTTHGRQKGKNMIFDGIEKYIAQSEQTRGRTFHVTMTYFWIQMVHFGIRSMPPPVADSDASSLQTLVADEEPKAKVSNDWAPNADDFPRFLLLNPFVADGNLWADYYSKEVIMSPEAKAGMVLPDRKPLPNLVVRESIKGKGST
ncbi:ADP-ribosylation factor [Roridomyces roridus]|uniref:ADP-ribosylation factor n=1 Tax=Roridomyces roridus TaxID=1738132 RepID=A0AAD7FZ81_9AGAR|nr:ADP-ribosylation factor [Roridomyces roridus]